MFLACFCTPALVHLVFRAFDQSKPNLLALALRPAASLFKSEETLTPEKILQLLQASDVKVRSVSQGYVTENEQAAGVPAPLDWTQVGYARSPFIAEGKWSTIRFLGPQPAGAGLATKEMEAAQKQKLGTAQDTTPVVTAAWTIDKMMEEFFAPLLSRLPNGTGILSRIRIQGVYYSPLAFEAENEPPQYDNAFIVGLQSMRLFPSSCFDPKGLLRQGCSGPQFTTGHDPSVVAHELSHVIFNHMREEKSLYGFQWFAVNEGYADYFSAAFLKEPYVGRIWKANSKTSPYLRRLIDNPDVNSEEYSEEIHAFSVIWSSFLWRLREAFKGESKSSEADFNRVVLMSIAYLGETDKTKLGDAATALLKSAETLGFSNWKKTILKEANASKMEVNSAVAATDRFYDADAKDGPQEPNSSGCGSLAAVASGSGTSIPTGIRNSANPAKPRRESTQKAATLLLLFPFLPLLVLSLRKRGTRTW